MVLLAAVTDKSSRLFAETLPWLLLLLGVIIAGGVIIFLARRYVNSGSNAADAGFTLHDLREMHKAGEISDGEFTRAKAHMIGRVAAQKAAASVEDPANASESDDASPGNPPEPPQ